MKRVFLDSNFLFSKEVMPFQGNELSYTYPAPNDIPKEIDVTPSQGGNDVAMRFVYGDREEAGVEETVLDSEADSPIHLILGRYSGKLMSLRVSGNKEGVPAVAERLRVASTQRTKKNQELNFLLLSNILREKQDELSFSL